MSNVSNQQWQARKNAAFARGQGNGLDIVAACFKELC